jgi:hypothetical protein
MLNVSRPSSEVVKEGRILKKIKHLQNQIAGVFWCQFLARFLRDFTIIGSE